MSSVPISERAPLQGVKQIFFFNWPLYLVVAAALAGAVVLSPALSLIPRIALLTSAAVVGAWVTLTLVVSWWVYDHSALYQWQWLHPLLPSDPASYLVVTAGFDEISADLRAHFPAATQAVIDILDPDTPLTGSIKRARKRSPATAVASSPSHIPAADASQDTIFVVFAAHELRHQKDRESLFAECARTLRPHGRLVLVEHLRDAANVGVFGPGAWHFYPRSEWLRCGAGAGFAVAAERTMTPFVHALAFAR